MLAVSAGTSHALRQLKPTIIKIKEEAMYLKIKTSSTNIAGIGPTAWTRDKEILQMYTPHHPEHRDEHHVYPERRTGK